MNERKHPHTLREILRLRGRFSSLAALARRLILPGLLLFALPVLRAQPELLQNTSLEGPYVNDLAPSWGVNHWSSATFSAAEEVTNVRSGASAQRISVTALPAGSGVIFKQEYTMAPATVYRGSVWVRSPDGVKVRFFFRRIGANFDAVAAKTIVVGPEWQRIEIEGGFIGTVGTFFGLDFRTTGTLILDDASLTNISTTTGVYSIEPVPAHLFGAHINKLGAHFTFPVINVGAIRIWDTSGGTIWSQLETAQDIWDFTRFDRLVNWVKTNNPQCDIIYTLGVTPLWAAARPDETLYNGSTSEPDEIEDWRDYVRTVATRYKGKIKYYEIWNESDQRMFFSGTPAAMVQLAAAAREELKAVDPDITVLSPNITRSGISWLDEYLFLGGGQHADMMSYHAYLGLTPENRVAEYHGMRNLMANHGLGNKVLWNTEGAPATVPPQPPPTIEQARGAAARAYLSNWIFGLQNYGWYGWDLFHGGANAVRLATNNYTDAEPAGVAVRELARWLVGSSLTSRATQPDGTWLVGINLNTGASGYIVWNTNGTVTFPIPAEWSVTHLKNLAGGMTPLNGASSVEIGLVPVLLQNTDPLPPAPSWLTAKSNTDSVSLNWTPVPGAARYNVKRSLTNGGPYTTIATTALSEYRDTGANFGPRHYYSVTALNAVGSEGALSNQAHAFPYSSVNRARGKPATASSNASNSSAAFAFDANSGTRWGSAATDPQWIRVDLQATYAVNRVVLRWEDAGIGSAYAIQVSLDGTTWSDVYTTTQGDGDYDEITFPAVNARYVRMYGTARASSFGYSLWEFEVYDTTGAVPPPPIAPAGLIASAPSSTRIALSWSDNSNNEDGFKIERSSNNSLFSQLAVVGPNETTYSDVGLTASTTYYYRVNAYNRGGDSGYTNAVSATTPAPSAPEAPTGLTAAGGLQEVTLSWTPAFETDNYNIKRSEFDAGPYTTIASGVTSTSYIDSGLTSGRTYYYVVSAVNTLGESPDSTQASAPAFAGRVAVADAFVRDGSANAGINYGADSLLTVKLDTGTGFNREAFVRFDASGLTAATQLKIRLVPDTVNADGATTTLRYQFVPSDTWEESAITWSNKPAGSTVFATITGHAAAVPVDIDVTSQALVEAAGDGLLSLRIHSTVQGSARQVNFAAREHANVGRRPTLLYLLPSSAPLAPTGAQTAASSAQVELTWLNSGGADSYYVRRATTPGGPYSVVANNIVGTSFSDSNIVPGVTYYYLLAARGSGGNSANSSELMVVVPKAAATVTLHNLNQIYNGQPKSVTATTVPAGLPVNVTYGTPPSVAAPTFPGAYPVVATIQHPSYAGLATANLTITTTALVERAPTINGDVDGSVQVLTAENVVLNGGAMISNDLLVPGTPTVVVNGAPTFVGGIDGSGAATPSGHQLVLNGGAVLRYLVRRTQPVVLPVVTSPPAPTGTRNVALNTASQPIGDFATLRDLTLNGGAGQRSVPAGNHGTFIANGGTGFVFGVAGSNEPALYSLQGLTLNGGSTLQVVGPVVLTIASGSTIAGIMGNPDHPEWLTLNIAAGDVILNSGARLHGRVVAPAGRVIINDAAEIEGQVTARELTIGASGLLRSLESNP